MFLSRVEMFRSSDNYCAVRASIASYKLRKRKMKKIRKDRGVVNRVNKFKFAAQRMTNPGLVVKGRRVWRWRQIAI